MDISLILSIFFLVACAGSLISGAYVLYQDVKASLNDTFFLVTLLLGVWAFGFSFSCFADNAEKGEFWLRVAAFGWTLIYSAILHFTLLLTGKSKWLKKKWAYPLVYIPGLIACSVFSLPIFSIENLYHMLHTPYGWTNAVTNGILDGYFRIYYVSFSLITLLLIWNWYRKSADTRTKKQALIVFISFLVSMVVGTLTDTILPAVTGGKSPPLAPIILLIPIVSIYYAITRHGLMKGRVDGESDLILRGDARKRVYFNLSVLAFGGGFLNLLVEYFLAKTPNSHRALILSVILVAIGLFLQAFQWLRFSEAIKESVLVIGMAIGIPLFSQAYYGAVGVTIWAFPFMLLIFSLLFTKRTPLIVISASIFVTLLVQWVFTPEAVVTLGKEDYLARIGVFAMGIWLAFFVHRVYLLRLKENEEQIVFQRLIVEISTDFVTVNEQNFDQKVNALLRQCGEALRAERTCVYLFDQTKNAMCKTHEWRMGSGNGSGQKLPGELTLLTEDTQEEQLALMATPIVSKEDTLGFLGVTSRDGEKTRIAGQVSLYRILSNILADALLKINAENEINLMAYYDHLTRLPNRRLFMDRTQQAIHLAKRTEKLLGVVFLNMDSFKAINDTMGHVSGDELIVEIAHALSGSVRKSDTVSRFGGDEFLILLTNMSSTQDIVKVTDNIIRLFHQPVSYRGSEIYLSASAGIAVYPTDGEEPETLIKNAGIAMYNAKRKGKKQFVLCTADMKDEVLQRMKLSNSLYRALEREELELYYQPQIDLRTNSICGLEALLRWNHPELGRVSPGVFIPLAEQSGLINHIGEWVIYAACKQNKAWQDMGLPRIRLAVNVSAIQFHNPNLVGQIARALRETGLPPKYLELEITESAAVSEVNDISAALSEIKKLGVSISIDDFGTEYSSLSRLKLLPIDRIKMDIQFVRGIEGDDKDRAITMIIINLAKTLDINVIAEGVETERQLTFLKKRMCDEVQGYYYFKPMPAAAVETLLRENVSNGSV